MLWGQRLIRKISGGGAAAIEILLSTASSRDAIAKGEPPRGSRLTASVMPSASTISPSATACSAARLLLPYGLFCSA